jgi:broad-specificity NMP kinase
MKKIYITGVSGTGKTTIAKELEKKGFYVISIDEVPNLCIWINKETKEKVIKEVELNKDFINTHDWVCDVEYLQKLIDTGISPIFVLGLPSNQNELINLFDKVLLLQCKPETFISRIENRTDNDFGKDKSAQEVILSWYKNFEQETLKKGAISISVEESLDEVVDNILKQAS